MSKNFFVTTPIYYVNDIPHIGHAYATFAADILARFNRQIGKKVFFLTGTDENSQKTVLAAKKAGKDTSVYASELSKKWKITWEKLEVSFDDFIRTTENRHHKIVTEIFNKIVEKGDIYKGKYEGLYCVGHEAFLKEEDLDDKGLCPDHKTKPNHLIEENYFFRLSKYQDILLAHLEKNKDFVNPKARYNEVRNFLKSGLQDISITRSTQKWGIPAPIDESHVIYVWFDALINYISANPSKWPVDLHIIGKDILRFHAVIWPAMLLSAEYPLPKKIFAHGFFTIDDQKISKSLGNAIDPIKISDQYGTDTLRYYLFKEIPFGNDGNFSFDRLREVYNSDLANGLGNLVARVAKLAENSDLLVEKTSNKKPDPKIEEFLNALNFQDALEYIWSKITKADLLIEKEKPWELIKKDKQRFEAVLNRLIDDIRQISADLNAFLPNISEIISKQFSSPRIKSQSPLFPRK